MRWRVTFLNSEVATQLTEQMYDHRAALKRPWIALHRKAPFISMEILSNQTGSTLNRYREFSIHE